MPSPHSYYHNSLHPSYQLKRSSLQKDIRTQICIIGAGFSGVSSALHLAKAGYDVTILEKNFIGYGASGRNGGQVSTGQRLDVQQLEKKYGRDKAYQLWRIGLNAAHLVKSIIDENAIECDYQKGIYYTAWKKRHLPELHKEAALLKKHYHFSDVETLDHNEIRNCIASEAYYGGIYDKTAAHLHPLNYVLGMAKAAEAKNVTIYTDSEVVSWKNGSTITVQTPHATLLCDKLIFCCNGYLDNLFPYAAKRILPINNFIIATEPLEKSIADTLIHNNAAVCDSKFIVEYYRLSACKRLLFGGGESYSKTLPDAAQIKNIVLPLMVRVFPQLRNQNIDFSWGGTLAITRTRLPSLGVVDDNIYYLQGYSGAGVAMATMAGKLLADSLTGNKEAFDLMCEVAPKTFPGGIFLRWPLILLGLRYHALLDRL